MICHKWKRVVPIYANRILHLKGFSIKDWKMDKHSAKILGFSPLKSLGQIWTTSSIKWCNHKPLKTFNSNNNKKNFCCWMRSGMSIFVLFTGQSCVLKALRAKTGIGTVENICNRYPILHFFLDQHQYLIPVSISVHPWLRRFSKGNFKFPSGQNSKKKSVTH